MALDVQPPVGALGPGFAERISKGLEALGVWATDPRFSGGITGDGVAFDDDPLDDFLEAAAEVGYGIIPTHAVLRLQRRHDILGTGTVIWMVGAEMLLDNAAADIRMLCVDPTIGGDECQVFGFKGRSANATTRGHQLLCLLNGAKNCLVQWYDVTDFGQFGVMLGDTDPVGHGGGGGNRLLHGVVDCSNNFGAGSAGVICFPKGGANYQADGLVVDDLKITVGSTVEAGLKFQNYLGPQVSRIRGIGNNNEAVYFTGILDMATGNTGVRASKIKLKNSRLALVMSGPPDVVSGLRNKDVQISEFAIDGVDAASGTARGIYCQGGGVDQLSLNTGRISYKDGATANALLIDLEDAAPYGFPDFHIDDVRLEGGPAALWCISTGGAGFKNAIIGDRVVMTGQTGNTISRIDGDDVAFSGKIRSFQNYGVQINGARPRILSGAEALDGNLANVADVAAFILNGVEPRMMGKVRNTGTGHLKWGYSVLAPCAGYRVRHPEISGMESGAHLWAPGIASARPTLQSLENALTSPQSHTGDTAESTLVGSTVTRGALGPFGSWRARLSGSTTGTGGNKTLKLKWGGNTLATFVITPAVGWVLVVELNFTGAQNSARWNATLTRDDSVAVSAQGSSAVDLGGADRAIQLTGQLASAGDTVTVNSFTVEQWA